MNAHNLINDVLTKILHLMGKLVVFDDICKLELPVAVGAYGQTNHTKHISGGYVNLELFSKISKGW